MSEYLTDEKLEELWLERGLQYRLKRLHKYLLSCGLMPMVVPEYLFLEHMKEEILRAFLVRGVKERPNGQQSNIANRDGKTPGQAGRSEPEEGGSARGAR